MKGKNNGAGVFQSRNRQSELAKSKNLKAKHIQENLDGLSSYMSDKLSRMSPLLEHLSRDSSSGLDTTYNHLFFEAHSLVELSINAWEQCQSISDREYVTQLTTGWTIIGCMALEFAFKYHLVGQKSLKGKFWDDLSWGERKTHEMVKLDNQLSTYNEELHKDLKHWVESREHLIPNRESHNDYSKLVRDLVYFHPDFRYTDLEAIEKLDVARGAMVRRNMSIILFLTFFRGKMEKGEINKINKDVLTIEEIMRNKENPKDNDLMDFNQSFRQGEIK